MTMRCCHTLLRGLTPARPARPPAAQAPGPLVLFASPGMLTGGLSLEAFKAWAGGAANLVVLPGYQVAGTLGARLNVGGGGAGGQAAQRARTQAPQVLDVDGERLEVRPRPGGAPGPPARLAAVPCCRWAAARSALLRAAHAYLLGVRC